jgi:cell division protein ZapA
MTEPRDAIRPLSVRILEKEYIVACGPDERTDLLDSAEILNKSMREIRDSGKIAGLDRIAVMAALNLAHEVLKLRARDVGADQNTGHRIKALRERVESALEKGQQLEL